MPKPPASRRRFEDLVQVITELRGPEGCPWDREQTHASLARFAIEEAHEFAEAVDGGRADEIRDELGDLLLQVVLNAEVARQEGRFTLEDVIQSITEKMVRRHPHVFDGVKVAGSADVLKNWAEIKAAEKPARGPGFDVPKHLPALLRAHKIGEKTKSRAFDWENADQCWEKVREELGELESAVAGEGETRVEEELGDVLFSLSQWARHRGLDAEAALRRTNRRFEARYLRMRAAVDAAGLKWEDVTPEQKERYWKAAKA